MIPVLVSAFAPFPKTISLALEEETQLADIPIILRENYGVPATTRLTLQDGHSLPQSGTLASISNDQHAVLLRLSVKLCGGKGGFSSQLRAAGGRMSRRRGEKNNGSCRDLNGRRLSSVREAASVAAYVESAPEREKKLKEEKKTRLEALQKEVQRLDNAVNGNSPQAGGSNLGKRSREQEEFVEQSKEAVDGVRGALAAAMLKKRKKQAEAKAKAEGAATDKDGPPPSKKVALEVISDAPTASKTIAAAA